MKKSIFRFIPLFALLAIGGFTSCDDTNEPKPGNEEQALSLSTGGKEKIFANGIDAIAFSVTNGPISVTKQAEIWILSEDGKESKLTGTKFSTETAGVYKFEARHTQDGRALKSNIAEVEAVKMPEEEFFRTLFVQQFTSTGCPSCPSMTTAFKSLESKEEWKGRMARAVFHTVYGGVQDPMAIKLTAQYMSHYGFGGLPTMVLDLILGTNSARDERAIAEQMTRVLKEYPATCGVAIDSKYDASTGKVNFTVKVKSGWTNEYRILAFLVEDGIVAAQMDDRNYVHNNTVRAGMAQTLTGDKFGTIEQGKELSQDYSMTVDRSWKTENMRVLVCIVNSMNGGIYGNNAAECPLTGSVDYKYNNK